MSRDEAIRRLKVLTDYEYDEDEEALNMAIEALEQEPCEDAISRQAVLEMAYDMSEIDGEHFTEPCMVIDVEDVQKLPSVNPQEPKWIPVTRRLPEKDDLYLICFDDGEFELVYFSKGAFSYSGVVAWIPLPQPYEPKGVNE